MSEGQGAPAQEVVRWSITSATSLVDKEATKPVRGHEGSYLLKEEKAFSERKGKRRVFNTPGDN